jgi:hypothetical protein
MRTGAEHEKRAARARWADWAVLGLIAAAAVGCLLWSAGSSAASSGPAEPVQNLMLAREALVLPLLLALLAAGMVLGGGNDSGPS